jgi:hypothetical protein
MKKFLLKIMLFVSIFVLISISVIFLPVTPRASKSLLFSKINKDSLLQNVISPRIIFIGGSNLSFGLNSTMIKESLRLNPINTAVHAGTGLIYMLDNTLPYIQSGDIIVVAPEYNFFYGKLAYGEEELLRTILDVSPSELWGLRIKQYANIIEYIPKYFNSKIKTSEYFDIEESVLYGIKSFNEYGDVYTHWELEKQEFPPVESIPGRFNYSVINALYDFKKSCIEKRAILFITFPGFQSASFENSKEKIMKVDAELKKKDINLLGTPERYSMPDSLMFNSPYHLSKKGVDYRTQLLIEDLKDALTKHTENLQYTE